MIRRQIFNDSVWIDVERPSASEVKALIREFGISELIAEELRSPTIRPKAEYFRDQIYLVLHYPKIRQKKTVRTHPGNSGVSESRRGQRTDRPRPKDRP